MVLAFAERELRDLCASRNALDRRFGLECGQTFRERLADLRAAPCIHDLPLRKPDAVDSSGRMSLEVARRIRIVFYPNHRRIPLDGDGRIDWSRVSRIKIIAIESTQ